MFKAQLIGLCLGFAVCQSPSVISGNCTQKNFELVEYQLKKLRRSSGLGALQKNDVLQSLARARVQTLADLGKAEHNSTSQNLLKLIALNGMQRQKAGENIIKIASTESPFSILRIWMRRQSEKENLLSPDFKYYGLAHNQQESNCFCVLLLSD